MKIADTVPIDAIEFFWLFSRFEYALKRAGFVHNKENAEVNWDQFSAALGPSFFDEVIKNKIAPDIISRPPKKQIVKDKTLGWKQADPASTTSELLVAIRRIRNNLFHGGKFLNGPEGEVARDQLLLRQARAVIVIAISKNGKVEQFYKNP